MRQEIKNQWIAKVKKDAWMDEIIFGFADLFPPDQIDTQGSAATRNVKCADILEATGVFLPKHMVQN